MTLMQPNDERTLIVGLLSRRDAGLVRQESLEGALGMIRRVARRRRLWRSAAVCAPLVIGLVWLFRTGSVPERLAPAALPHTPTAQTAPASSAVFEPIDDQELLALLPGKTVALIGPPGRGQLLVFDAPGGLETRDTAD
jgi:hypothetical protein